GNGLRTRSPTRMTSGQADRRRETPAVGGLPPDGDQPVQAPRVVAYETAMSPAAKWTAPPLGLLHCSLRSITWTAADWFGSIHWNENASGPPPAGTNRVTPGLL